VHKKRLDSWKTIAEFLGRSLRTVQRWHNLNGLPVHHFGGQKGSVFAYEEEIDAWLASLAEGAVTERILGEENREEAKRTSRELSASADSMWEMRSVKNIRTISHLYHSAIDHDSTNVAALIGLANASIFGSMNEVMDAAIAVPIARGALRKLMPLKYDLLDSKCPSAWIDLLFDRELRRARAGFEEVLRRQPASSFARVGLAMSSLASGDVDDAIKDAWEAWQLDPLVASLRGTLCWCVYLSGDFGRLFDIVGQLAGLDDDGISTGAIEALGLAQDLPKNIPRLELVAQVQPDHDILQGILGYSYGVLGEQDLAREKFELLLLKTGYGKTTNCYARAIAALGTGDERQAISWLVAAYSQGSIWSLGFGLDPILRSLTGNLEFQKLLSSIGSHDHVVKDRFKPEQNIGQLLPTV
jgi:phage terminase Nu1 subunit (DNA packaging protein)